MRRLVLSVFAVAVLIVAGSISAQVATDPVGFTTTACPAGTDVLVGPPFTQIPDFTGSIASVTANSITFSGTPLTAGTYDFTGGNPPKAYVLIGPHASTNPNEGRIYTINSNTNNTLTVTVPTGDNITGIAANTQALIIKFSTLNSVFPASDAGVSYVVTTSSFSLKTQILIPDYAGTGINRSATATYFYMNNAWRKFGQPVTTDFGNDVLPAATFFILRNPAGVGPTTLTALGAVLTKKETIPLATQTGGPRDNFVAITRPIDVTLNGLGLGGTSAFTTTTSTFSIQDQLFVFNNAATGINKSASATYFYFNGAWRKFGQSTSTDFGTDIIPAGSGFVVRKVATAGGATAFWTNTPTY